MFGELIEVDDKMLATLDELERCPTWYYREESRCILTSSEVEQYPVDCSVTCLLYFQSKYDINDYSRPCVNTYIQDENCVKEWTKPTLFDKVL